MIGYLFVDWILCHIYAEYMCIQTYLLFVFLMFYSWFYIIKMCQTLALFSFSFGKNKAEYMHIHMFWEWSISHLKKNPHGELMELNVISFISSWFALDIVTTRPLWRWWGGVQYSNAIMGAMASQITSLTIVFSTVSSGADQRKHQSPASLAFVWGIHRWPVNSPHKWPVRRKMFPFDNVLIKIMTRCRDVASCA